MMLTKCSEASDLVRVCMRACILFTLSKRGGMDRVFRGLAGLHQGQGQSPREILRSSFSSPRKTLSIPTLLLSFTTRAGITLSCKRL